MFYEKAIILYALHIIMKNNNWNAIDLAFLPFFFQSLESRFVLTFSIYSNRYEYLPVKNIQYILIGMNIYLSKIALHSTEIAKS